MQFKTKLAKDGSKSWSLVRWRYDASKGRSCPTNIGTVSEVQLRLARKPADLQIHGRLDPEERSDLDEFWRATRPEIVREVHVRAARQALCNAVDVVEAIESGEVRPEDAAALWARLDQVASALRRAGLAPTG